MGLVMVRYVLPTVIVIAGIIMWLARPDAAEVAAMMIGAGLAVALLNWLYRLGVTGDEERDAEHEAREYFSAHGRWPDERRS